jgi:hypothetical protein
MIGSASEHAHLSWGCGTGGDVIETEYVCLYRIERGGERFVAALVNVNLGQDPETGGVFCDCCLCLLKLQALA